MKSRIGKIIFIIIAIIFILGMILPYFVGF